jgi:hypothetical protein
MINKIFCSVFASLISMHALGSETDSCTTAGTSQLLELSLCSDLEALCENTALLEVGGSNFWFTFRDLYLFISQNELPLLLVDSGFRLPSIDEVPEPATDEIYFLIRQANGNFTVEAQSVTSGIRYNLGEVEFTCAGLTAAAHLMPTDKRLWPF